MNFWVGLLLIFCLRVTDVSMGTVRVIYAVRGRRIVAMVLGLVEASVFIFALSRTDLSSPWKMLAYAAGFAAGNFVGISLEQWIASGTILVRIVLRERVQPMLDALRDSGFGSTMIQGAGQGGDVGIFFVVAPRRREKELLKLIELVDPDAFITVDAVHQTRGGYLSSAAPQSSVRK